MELNKISLALLLTTLLTATVALAQTVPSPEAQPIPLSGNAPGGPPVTDRGRPAPHQPDQQPGLKPNPHQGRNAGLTSLTTLAGTVGQWTGNDDYILDGFTLSTGSAGTTTVTFPPHLGQQIQKAAKTGSPVKVTGFADTTPQGESRFRLTSLTSGGTTVLDGPPTSPATPPATPEATTITGKIVDYRLDRKGQVNGLIMSDRTLVRIPSHVAYQLTNLVTKGSTITVLGYPRFVREGQVQLERTNILQASVLTINGQQYLVR